MPHSRIANSAISRLEADGIVRITEKGPVTTQRWQAAMMRAIGRLVEQGEVRQDIRIPITRALLQIYGDRKSDPELLELVMAMTAVEANTLGIPVEGSRDTLRPETKSH